MHVPSRLAKHFYSLCGLSAVGSWCGYTFPLGDRAARYIRIVMLGPLTHDRITSVQIANALTLVLQQQVSRKLRYVLQGVVHTTVFELPIIYVCA